MFLILFDPTIIFVIVGFFGLGLYGIFQGAFSSIITVMIWTAVISVIALVLYGILVAVFKDTGKIIFGILVALAVIIYLAVLISNKAIISYKESHKSTSIYYMKYSGEYMIKDRIYTDGRIRYGTIPAGSFVAITPSYEHEDRCYLNWHEQDGSNCSCMPDGTADEYKQKFRLSDECYEITYDDFNKLDSWWELDEVQSLVK